MKINWKAVVLCTVGVFFFAFFSIMLFASVDVPKAGALITLPPTPIGPGQLNLKPETPNYSYLPWQWFVNYVVPEEVIINASKTPIIVNGPPVPYGIFLDNFNHAESFSSATIKAQILGLNTNGGVIHTESLKCQTWPLGTIPIVNSSTYPYTYNKVYCTGWIDPSRVSGTPLVGSQVLQVNFKIEGCALPTDPTCSSKRELANFSVPILVSEGFPSISITAPVGGEQMVYGGNNFKVQWTISGASQLNSPGYKIDLLQNGQILGYLLKTGSSTPASYYTDSTLWNFSWAPGTYTPYSTGYLTAATTNGSFALKATLTDGLSVVSTYTTPLFSVTGLPSKPDLVVSSITQSPTSATVSSTINFDITVMNQGTATAPTSTMVKSFDGTVFTTVTSTVSALAPGQSATFRTTTPPGYFTIGSHVLSATVDSTNIVTESNEANNIKRYSFQVYAPGTDLIIYYLSISPFSPTTSTPITVYATVKNQGIVAAPTSSLLFVGATGGYGGTTFTVPPIGAGGSYYYQYTLPLRKIAGAYSAYAQADIGSQIVESNETNNTKQVPFTVLAENSEPSISNLASMLDSARAMLQELRSLVGGQ